MVGMRLEDRVEIQTGHTELREPVEPLFDPPQVPAEVIVVADLPLFVRPPSGLAAPVVTQDAAVGQGDRTGFLRPGEPVGENLVHHAAGQPVGRTEALFIAGQLPQRAGRRRKGGGGVGLADEIPPPLPGLELEAVPDKTRFFGRIAAVPPFVAVVHLARPEHAVERLIPTVWTADQIRPAAPKPTGQEDPEQHRAPFLDRAEGVAVFRVAGIEQLMDRGNFRLRHAVTCLSSYFRAVSKKAPGLRIIVYYRTFAHAGQGGVPVLLFPAEIRSFAVEFPGVLRYTEDICSIVYAATWFLI